MRNKKTNDIIPSMTLNIGADKLSRIARHFSKAHGVDVRFVNAGGPSTDGKTIYLPEGCKEWSSDPILLDVLRGYLDRELWRIRENEIVKERLASGEKIKPSQYILNRLFTEKEIAQGYIETPAGNIVLFVEASQPKSTDDIMNFISKSGSVVYSDMISILSNAWEELRIQRSASRTYIGMRSNIARMHEYLQEKIKSMRKEDPSASVKNFFLDICNAPILIENEFIKEEWSFLSEQAQEWIDAYMPELMEASEKMITSEDMYNITIAMLQRIVNEIPPDPPKEDQSSDNSDNNNENSEGKEGEGEEGEGSSGSESGASSEMSDSSEGVASDDVNGEYSLEESNSESNSNKENENGGWVDAESLSESLKNIRDQIRNTNQMEGDNRPPGHFFKNGELPEIKDSTAQIFDGNYNDITKRESRAIPGAPKSVQDADYIQQIKSPRNDVLNKINKNVNYTARTLGRKLKNAIRVLAQEETECDKQIGDIDDNALADIVSGNKNIFMETSPGKNHNNIAWLFLVDMSGSMGDRKEILAIEACMTVAQAIADAGNENFCIAGFDNPGIVRDPTDHNFNLYVRQERMRIQLVKKFSDSWRKVKNNTTGMRAGYNNSDGDAIRWAAARLLEVDDVSRRELVVFSDGHPCAATVSYKDLNQDLINAIEEARSLGIGVSSVGILHDTNKFYGKENSLVVNNLDELSAQFVKMIRHKMIGGPGYVKRARGSKGRNKHLKF